jgi:hypothetical protein
LRQNPPQQHRLDASAKTNPAINFDHRNTLIKPLVQLTFGINVDARWRETMLLERPPRIVA